MKLPFRAALMALTLTTGAAQADEVIVFAAASMRTALDQIATDWQAETGHRVTLSYAGSSALARQIIAGAPADLFISASTQWMDAVAAAGALAEGTRRDLLGNSLVLIAPGLPEVVDLTPQTDLAGLLGDGWLAMALVDAVPAGQYGRAALQSLGLWDSVASRVAQADNVRAALALVATAEAPLGIVYATDAAAEPAVGIVATFPPETHPPITYPVALTLEARDAADRAFLEALGSPAARAVFEAQGFRVIDAP